MHDSLNLDVAKARQELDAAGLEVACCAAGRANVVTVLRQLAKEARGTGVILGLEICNRYETNVVSTARDALRLADDIGEEQMWSSTSTRTA